MILEQLDIRTMTGQQYLQWLADADETRRVRTLRYRQEEDRKRSAAADHLARSLISRWCGVEASGIRMGRNPWGKPFAMDLAVEFNLSHSGDYVLCAVDSRPIGVDVERVRPVTRDVMARVCTQAELAYVMQEQQGIFDRFFEIWTAKEAWFKCRGTGITQLHSVNVLPLIRSGCCTHQQDYVRSVVRFCQMEHIERGDVCDV